MLTLWASCGRDSRAGAAAARNGPCQEASVAGWGELTESTTTEVQAWIQGLSFAKCNANGGLALHGMDVPDEIDASHREALRAALQRNTSVQCLSIGDVSPTATRLLAEALQAAPHIREAKFVGPRADDDLARLLAALLKPVWANGALALQSLTIAHQRRNFLTDKGAVAIAQAIEENHHLKNLVLFGSDLGDSAAWALASALEQNRTLEALGFYGKRLTGKGTAAFCRMLQAGTCQLKELLVGGTEFNDQDASELLTSVHSARIVEPPRLCKISVLNYCLGDETAKAVAHILSCGIVEVNLLAGRMTDDGASAVARALADQASGAHSRGPGPELRTLRIASEKAGDVGLGRFAGAWSAGSPREHLELAFGGASQARCEEFVALGGAGSPGHLSAGGATRRTLTATCRFQEYLDEVVFSQLMLRAAPSDLSSRVVPPDGGA